PEATEHLVISTARQKNPEKPMSRAPEPRVYAALTARETLPLEMTVSVYDKLVNLMRTSRSRRTAVSGGFTDTGWGKKPVGH
ncbi:MAG TPA: hypothetical protein VFF52_07420, partial [Isosphaeraceae bacterium]|nr:hypothetical protein [Isosphaeraceae bacterium]